MHRGVCRRLSLERARRHVTTEANIKALGLELPVIAAPKGNYIQYQRAGNLVYLSGHLPTPAKGPMVTGRLGENMTTEQGYEAAKLVGLQMIATLQLNLGDLDKVVKTVKLFGIVNSTNDFVQQATVMNGCSDLFHNVFGGNLPHVVTTLPEIVTTLPK
jgi:enamine deaminase RidA (YjgF/YER057c/UK114 family)